jgi:hypothetical protein
MKLWSREEIAEFEEIVDPLIKWMNDKLPHPHHTVIVENGRAELLEGKFSIKNEKHWKD